MSTTTHGLELIEVAINPFKMHLSDAIYAVYLAKTLQSPHEKVQLATSHLLSRTAVAHAVFAFECAANCFIDQLPRDRAFRDRVEMWPALDKFDEYLLIVPGTPKLPRKDPCVEAMVGLIKLRDRHVHPRIKTLPLHPSEKAHMKISFKGEECVPIHSMANAWTPAEAVIAINTVLDFLRLFITLTKIPARGIIHILSSRMKCKDGDRRADLGDYDKILKLDKEIGVDCSFLIQ